MERTSHIYNNAKAKNTPKIKDFCSKNNEEKKLEESVKPAEFKILGFIHEHNLPFLIMDHLILLLVSIFPDSNIGKGLKCGRTKATKLTSILPYYLKHLKANHFL